MKKILIAIIMLILFPIGVNAEEIKIQCISLSLENNETTECTIVAKDLSFNATNISGEIKLSNNLELVSSNYDNSIWKSLDSKFSVKSINLISENKHNGKNFTIATFKVKAINKNDENGTINFTNVELGDEDYNGHNLNAQETNIELIYDNKNEEINKNPQTNGIKIIIPITLAIALLGCVGLIYKKRNI